MRQLGGTFGVAVFGTVFLHAVVPGTTPGAAALSGARNAGWVAVALIAATTVATALMIAAPGRDRAG